jgi:hypothetical protein
VLIRYQSYGGLQPPGVYGSVDLIVHRSGRASLHRAGRNRSLRISDRRLAALRVAIKRARFATLKRTYRAMIVDVPATSIAYSGRTVVLLEGATGPPRLRPLVALLARIAGA